MTDEARGEEVATVQAGDLLAEGRDAICTALAAAAGETRRPKLAHLLLDLRAEIAAGRRPEDMPTRGRANFAWRIADDYWRRRWDAISDDPPPHDEHLRGLHRMHRARRASYEWRWPGEWLASNTP